MNYKTYNVNNHYRFRGVEKLATKFEHNFFEIG